MTEPTNYQKYGATSRANKLRRRILSGLPLQMFDRAGDNSPSSDDFALHRRIGSRLHLLDLAREKQQS